ncbi:uncharacterized protein YALI1_C18713g [Yarrowia lipolytica]|uniref:Uncharacterized protein n=1 Tax=Yarrowia lipolytica TaxID=4952 RepID=A0A1D8NAZ2_YARLL|nr:hypothetical protein YALI1_C18713g [Yarrowia lipolytica]
MDPIAKSIQVYSDYERQKRGWGAVWWRMRKQTNGGFSLDFQPLLTLSRFDLIPCCGHHLVLFHMYPKGTHGDLSIGWGFYCFHVMLL